MSEHRLAAALWCAGVATFALLYAPQGLLTSVAGDLSVTDSQAALLVPAATAGLAVSVLGWARLSDRIGRAQSMRVAAVASVVLAILVPLLPTFGLLLAGRFVQGAALGGIPALALAVVHDVASPLRAATLAGSYVAATSVGGLAGRIVVVPIAQATTWRTGLLLTGLLLGVGMALLVFLLPRDARPATISPASPTPRAAGTARAAHLRNPRMLALFGIGGLLVGGMVSTFNFLPFRLEAAPYDLAPTVVSLLFLTYLAGTTGSRLTGRMTARWGHRAVLALGAVLMAVGVTITLATPLAVVVVGVVVLVTGLFVGHAAASSRVAQRATVGRAQATALYTVFYYVGSSVCGALAGLAWDGGGWVAVVAFVVVLAAAALVLALVAERRSDLDLVVESQLVARAPTDSPVGRRGLDDDEFEVVRRQT